MHTLQKVRSQGSGVRNRAQRITGSRAFTLLEIMIVVAIIAIFMTVSVPFIHTAIDGGKGMTRAIKDVQEACSHARATAILQQTTTELIIHPREGAFEIGMAGSDTPQHAQMDSPGVHGDNWRMPERSAPKSASGSPFSIRLPDTVHVEGLGVRGDHDSKSRRDQALGHDSSNPGHPVPVLDDHRCRRHR